MICSVHNNEDLIWPSYYQESVQTDTLRAYQIHQHKVAIYDVNILLILIPIKELTDWEADWHIF